MQLQEGEAENSPQILARDQPRPVDGKVHVRAVVAIEHGAGGKAAVLVQQPDGLVGADGPAAYLAHDPACNGVVRRLVARMDDSQMMPPGT